MWAGRSEEREYLRKVSSHRELEFEWSMLCQVAFKEKNVLIILWRNKEPALTLLLFQECTECWDRTGRRIASWRLWNCKLTVRSRQQSIFKTFLKSCFCFWTNSGDVLQNLNILCCAQQAAAGTGLNHWMTKFYCNQLDGVGAVGIPSKQWANLFLQYTNPNLDE